MRNIEIRNFSTETEALAGLLNVARNDERKNRALAVSERLIELALHIQQQELNGIEAADLVRREAERYQNESQDLH